MSAEWVTEQEHLNWVDFQKAEKGKGKGRIKGDTEVLGLDYLEESWALNRKKI